MWVFTLDGFYSVVQQAEFCSPDEVVVRTRVREDLERVLAQLERVSAYGDEPPEILSFVGTDYAYRAVVKLTEWSDYLAKAGRDIRYPSFKDRAAREDPARRAVYGEVWERLWQWQQEGHNG
jgi:hypothetical protein